MTSNPPGLRSTRPWGLIAAALCLPVLLPVGSVVAAYFQVDAALWAHFAQHVLPEVAANTLWLLAGVGVGVLLLGTVLAALVTLTEFPGRRFFHWALLLPLAMPGYVLATVYIGLLDYSGALASSLRNAGLALPEIRSRGGVILVLTFSLYPYVYLVARSAFASSLGATLEAARTLGHGPWSAFRRVSLPLAAPWIAGGTLLALMECLSDFGTVAAFNYDSFTTAIYKAWFALFSIDMALQLAGVLLLLAIALALGASLLQGRRRYAAVRGRQPVPPKNLGTAAWLATALCTTVFLAAFALPALQLAAWAWQQTEELNPRLGSMALHTLALAALAAGLTVCAALLLAWAARQQPGWLTRISSQLATLGYAFPGPLLALGLFVPYAAAINWLNEGAALAITVSGGLGLLLLAYVVRFMAVAHAPLASGLLRIAPSLEESARLLGAGPWRRLRQIHLPLLSSSLGTAALLVFVDVMKEMPVTLMMRPFGWDTLAVRIFELTSEGEWRRAATPALGIVLTGLLPVWLLNRSTQTQAPHQEASP